MKEATKAAIESLLRADDSVDDSQFDLVMKATWGTGLRRESITTAEAAEILDCCPATVRRYGARGYLTPIRITPRTIRWSKAQVEWLAYGIPLGEPK